MFKPATPLARAAVAISAAALIAACGSNSPSAPRSDANPTQAQLRQAQQDAVRFAACMRAHGQPDIPDPTVSPMGFKDAVTQAVKSTAGQAAYTACEHLLPPRQHSQRTPNSPARTAAFLEFAHCLRRHGFPNFPDPNGNGEITHEMLASNGISLQQPGLIEAANTCVSVTHGQLTKVDVAHFAAGH